MVGTSKCTRMAVGFFYRYHVTIPFLVVLLLVLREDTFGCCHDTYGIIGM